MKPYVREEDGKWWWFDVSYKLYGPYETEEEANIDYEYYVRFELMDGQKGCN